jgi:hypothetical protein
MVVHKIIKNKLEQKKQNGGENQDKFSKKNYKF